jgi:protein SCO1
MTVVGLSTRPRRRATVKATLLLLTASAMLGGCGSSNHAQTTTTTQATTTPAATGAAPTGLRGLVPTPLPVKPSFILPDTAGHPYNLDAATRGKLTYLFFGYTHCPDACPATMSYLAYALHQQPAAIRRQVAVVFVTVDPRRDTGPVLRTWLDHYNRSFVGVTGTLRQIGDVEHQAGIPTAIKDPNAGKNAAYQVEHSSILFVYSPDGRAHVVYAQGFQPSDYAHDLPLLLKFRSAQS